MSVEQDAAVERDVAAEPEGPAEAVAGARGPDAAEVLDAAEEAVAGEPDVAAEGVVGEADAVVREGDVTDPAYWARAEFAIKAPVAPALHSKLSCLDCSEGTAYGDGTGGYKCFRCGWSS